MSIKEKAKNKISKKVKKIAFKVLKPFLPFIIIIVGLFFAICTIIDAVFVQEVQSDSSSMSAEELAIKNLCIEKAEYLNTCNNYIDTVPTNYLLDMNNLENDKMIEWSHLYALMAFYNMSYNADMDENLLNEISDFFESIFIYKEITIKTETINIDENGNISTDIEEQTAYVLVESNTIIGHYKYTYEEQTVTATNTKITTTVLVNEELIGSQYERLRDYLQNELNIDESDIETDIQVVIEAANGYYEGEENTSWLQGTTSLALSTNGIGRVPLDMFIWPIPGYTTVTSNYGMRIHPITRCI